MKKLFAALMLITLLAASGARAQGFLLGGILGALPTVVDGIARKANANPDKYKDVDKEKVRREFEAQMDRSNVSPEFREQARQRLESVLARTDGLTGMARQQAAMNRDAPLFDTGKVVSSFLGGAISYQLMLGQVGNAGYLAKVGNTEDPATSAMRSADAVKNFTDLVTGQVTTPASTPTERISATTAISRPSRPIAESDYATFQPMSLMTLQGLSLPTATRESLRSIMEKTNATGISPGAGLEDLGDTYRSALPIPANAVNVGYDPDSRLVAMVAFDLSGADDEVLRIVSRRITARYGQPTISNEDGVARAYWPAEQGEIFVSNEANRPACGWIERGRLTRMVIAMKQRTESASRGKGYAE